MKNRMSFPSRLLVSLTVAWLVAFCAAITTSPATAAYTPSGDTIATGNITTQNLVPAGTATASSAVEIAMAGRAGVVIQTTGTYTGALSIQGTVNGTVWVTMSDASLLKNVNSGAYAATIASATQGIFILNAPGYVKVRVTGLAAMSGTATVTINANAAPNMTVLASALPAGSAALGSVTVASGTITTVTTANLAASSTITPIPLTTQGCSTTAHVISTASTNAVNVKNGVGVLCALQVSNINAAIRYLKLYNKASAPTVGTDTPVMTIMLPPSSNQVLTFAPFGFRFSTGISYALTTGMAVADTGAISAAETSVGFVYN